MGTIRGIKDIPLAIAPYGASKAAAANFLVRKINFEHDDIATFGSSPWVCVPLTCGLC